MADDKPNKSDKEVNGKMPKHLDEAFAQREYLTSYEYLSGKDDLKKLHDRLAEYEKQQGKETPGGQAYQGIAENIGFLEQDIGALDKSYADRENARLANVIAIYTKTANVNQRTTTLSGRQRFFKEAKGSAERFTPTETIEANIQRGIQGVSELGTEIAGRARGIGAEEIPDVLREKAGRISQI